MGRFCIWTQSAFDALDSIYGAPLWPSRTHVATNNFCMSTSVTYPNLPCRISPLSSNYP
jgi:hypothetical protein